MAELHRTERIGWLRAAVLGANDGIMSTASLLLGVAAAHVAHRQILLTGVAGLAAGAMAMASGEYVSVHSQADTEQAEIERERAELLADPAGEERELSALYRGRGLSPELADAIAKELMSKDRLAAHMRDELGMSTSFAARPLQAAFASAGSFIVGAIVPLLAALFSPSANISLVIGATSLLCLAGLGALAAQIGGAPVARGTVRVVFWGALAMATTSGVGALFGVNV